MSASHDGHDDHAADAADGPIIISVSTRHPRSRTIQIVRPSDEDSTFLAATAAGLAVTFKHFVKNLFLPLKKLTGRTKVGAPIDESFKNDIETVQYPEEKIVYPERFRGLHRLMLREDGAARCVACMCCPTICPAHCITIVPEESTDPTIEKRPAIFEIDELRCIACGLCVEACPCDAIRMDTRLHVLPVEDRADAVQTLATMMARGLQSTAVQGGAGPNWRSGGKPDPEHGDH